VGTIFRFFKSVRLAMVLILVIIALSLCSTLVPQRQPEAWYAARYPHAIAAVIGLLHLSDIFRSVLFLVSVGLFTLNLTVCTADRVIRRARAGAARRFGPDLLHVGLLVLIAAGLLTSLAREEAAFTIAEGEEVAISPADGLRLVSFQVLYYDTGDPKEWISTVRVTHDGREEAAVGSIRVNHPLRIGGFRVYQSTWDVSGTLELADADGAAVDPPSTGDYFTWEGERWTFAGYARPEGEWRAVFMVASGDGGTEDRRLFTVGDGIGPFTVRGVSARAVTGLTVVRDPGRIPFLVALPLILAGLCLGFLQKKGDAEI
jgi:hypothetical protein